MIDGRNELKTANILKFNEGIFLIKHIMKLIAYSFVLIDINECTDKVGACDQTCVNTVGGYKCSCNPGFRLVGKSRCEGTVELVINSAVHHEA